MVRHDEKQAMRETMLSLRESRSEETRHVINEGIRSQVLQDTDFHKSRTIFIYCSVGSEVDTHAMIHDCFQNGKTVCVPRCVRRGWMEAYSITRETDLIPGKFDIPEPRADCHIILPEEIDVAIVPCLCADHRGFRLGYGGGYYDRFLARTSAVTLLLCPNAQLFMRIPTEPHDQRCQKIITESGGIVAQ